MVLLPSYSILPGIIMVFIWLLMLIQKMTGNGILKSILKNRTSVFRVKG